MAQRAELRCAARCARSSSMRSPRGEGLHRPPASAVHKRFGSPASFDFAVVPLRQAQGHDRSAQDEESKMRPSS
jgi:hypothetical protein